MLNHLLIIGCGNMGGAMLAGWLAAGENPARFSVLDPLLPEAPEGVALYRDAVEVPEQERRIGGCHRDQLVFSRRAKSMRRSPGSKPGA